MPVSAAILATVRAASWRIRSAMPSTATGSPSTAMTAAVWPSSSSAATRALTAALEAVAAGLPIQTRCPPTRAVTPRPGSALNPVAACRGSPASRAAATTARASGCSDGFSAAAASARICCSPRPLPGSTRMAASLGAPSVSVPVLSNATTPVPAAFSMATADLTSTPCRPALAIAESSGGMVASTTAHGEATIMNVIARSSDAWNASPASSGTVKSSTVAVTMPREYRCSTFSMNSWVRALVPDASSTMAAMRAITVSVAARLTLTVSAPVPFMVPANTSSPGSLTAGSGSPVIVA